MTGVERYELEMQKYWDNKNQEEYDRKNDLREKLINSHLYYIDLWHTNLITEETIEELFEKEEIDNLEKCIPIYGFGSYTGLHHTNNAQLIFPTKKIIEKLDGWLEQHKYCKGEH